MTLDQRGRLTVYCIAVLALIVLVLTMAGH
jgi:hypothetical protein